MDKNCKDAQQTVNSVDWLVVTQHCSSRNGWSPLTGGHWESLSAAIICTFRCLLWDFPLDLTSLWSTWQKGKGEGEVKRSWKTGPPAPNAPVNPPYLRRGNLHVDDDGREGGFGELRGMVDGVRVQNHQLQGFGELKYPLNLTLNLRCKTRCIRVSVGNDCFCSPREWFRADGHLGWSECWISPLWAFCWGRIFWLKTGRQ